MKREEIISGITYNAAKAAVKYSQQFAGRDELQQIVIAAYEEGAQFGFDFAVQKSMKERDEKSFLYMGREASWNELPYEVRKHDYPYYFDGDLDCFPFIQENHDTTE